MLKSLCVVSCSFIFAYIEVFTFALSISVGGRSVNKSSWKTSIAASSEFARFDEDVYCLMCFDQECAEDLPLSR